MSFSVFSVTTISVFHSFWRNALFFSFRFFSGASFISLLPYFTRSACHPSIAPLRSSLSSPLLSSLLITRFYSSNLTWAFARPTFVTGLPSVYVSMFLDIFDFSRLSSWYIDLSLQSHFARRNMSDPTCQRLLERPQRLNATNAT